MGVPMISTDTTTAILATVNVLYSLAYVFLSGSILRRNGLRQPGGRLLLLYAIISALWTLGLAALALAWLPPPADEILARALVYAPLLLALLFLLLTRQFLQLGSANWRYWLLGLGWIAFVAILKEDLLGLPEEIALDGLTISHPAMGAGALILGWGLFMAMATYWTLRAYRQIQQPLHRNRIVYWFVAQVFTIAGAALFFAGYEAPGNGLFLLGAVGMAFAILTHSLPDVRQMTRRSISYLVITLLTVVVYAAVFLGIQYLLQSTLSTAALYAGVATALFLAVLANPVLNRLQKAVEQRVSGAGYDPSQTLRQYSTSISNILDLDRLATVAIGLVSEAMEIRRGALFVVHQETDPLADTDLFEGTGSGEYFSLRGVTGMGEDQPPGTLDVESPVTGCLRLERRPLTQYDVDLLPRFRDTPEEERDWLKSLKMDVYVPIYIKEEWIGLLALGPKTSGDRYYNDDLYLLSTVADQTAVALQNARLFDDLKIRNAENEQLNKDLTKANLELVRFDKAKSDFINIASHELMTPLTKIRGYNDLLAELIKHGSLTPESGQEMIQGVRGAVGQLEEIAKTMFDVSKIDTEMLALNLWPTSIETAVNSGVGTWKEALEERNLTLVVGGLMDLPAVIADSERLEQALSQLVQNAIKFTPDGGKIRIMGHLRDENLPPEDQTIEIVVSDSGIGIATDDLERIFDKFYRAGDIMLHSTGKTKFMGAGPGLGLTVVRGIVEAHGGFVWAESPGQDEKRCPGSEFHVVLPVRPRHPQRGITPTLDDTTIKR